MLRPQAIHAILLKTCLGFWLGYTQYVVPWSLIAANLMIRIPDMDPSW